MYLQVVNLECIGRVKPENTCLNIQAHKIMGKWKFTLTQKRYGEPFKRPHGDLLKTRNVTNF